MSTPDPRGAEESATEQVSFDKPTTQMPAPPAGTSPYPAYGPQGAPPYDLLPGQRYDPQTGRPLAPPARPVPPAYNYNPPQYVPPAGLGPQHYGPYPPPGYGCY